MTTVQPVAKSNRSSASTAHQPTGSSSASPIKKTATRIDRFVELFKWPSAVVASVATPFLAWSLVRLALRILSEPTFSLIPLAAGAFAFWTLWRRWLGKSRFGSALITLEHELTHAAFAVLTFHRIVGFRATLGRGGEIRFAGKGNWLILAAPYFFPSAAILLFLVAYFLPFASLPWQSLLLGVALAYHVVSTIRETHRDQSDLKLLGPTFCWMFLPAANLAVVGLLISFAHLGTEGVSDWLASTREPIQVATAALSSLLGFNQE